MFIVKKFVCVFILGMSHSYTEETIDSRRSKSKSKSLQRGHSLEDSVPDGGQGGRLKSAASESMLAGDTNSLNVPEGGNRKHSSKLSLIGDKLGDAARLLTDKSAAKKSKFSVFKKKSSRDPSPNEKSTRARSSEHGSLDRVKSGYRSGGGRSPNRSSTLPITRISDEGDANGSAGGMMSIESPGPMIPYEFRDSMGRGRDFSSDGSDQDLSESDLLEMNAWAEQIDEYTYSVRIFPGQDPSQVYVGWMTPGFHALERTFETKKTRHTVVSILDNDYRIKTR